ncbi:DUF1128 domain-containing protein [Lentibacillus amyloliquefaciens]|uniref:Uncharacterized protein n=1 Tax=Lentibacillus amyloliquefaciens TaxID=1472767 RepID=A0A0U4FAB3_9BACI|nr:DUF1128 domain-containing protein [Lentibacillus amyloliquefaciens]ALX47437.1 hypothetical protein AOX59_01775 [Lentibacillus amyloliquefaciens]
MNLETPSKENLKFMLDGLAEQLEVVNREVMDADDYDLDKYEDIKFMYEMITQKGQLTPSETQAFIAELRSVRKS